MSPHYSSFRPWEAGREPAGGPAASSESCATTNTPHENIDVDSAIDAALRAVPLPDGMMTRLGLLVYKMPEQTPGWVDSLGC